MHSVCSCKKNAIGMYSSCHNVVRLELTADHENGNFQNRSSLNLISFQRSAYRSVTIHPCILNWNSLSFTFSLLMIYASIRRAYSQLKGLQFAIQHEGKIT